MIYEKMLRRLLEAGLTKKFIADQCGADPSAVRRWSKGIASPNTKSGDKIQWMVAIIATGGPRAAALRKRGASKKGLVPGVRPTKPPSTFDIPRIRKLMDDNGWSVADLARLCGMTTKAIYKWLCDRANPSDAADHLLAQLEAHPPTRQEITATRMEYDRIGPARVKAIMESLGLDDHGLAAAMGVGVSTARQWINGAKVPQGASARLLRNLELDAGIINAKDDE